METPDKEDPVDTADLRDNAEFVNVGGAAQLGTGRFVYAAYFAGAIAIAYLLTKAVDGIWTKLEHWKPELGAPRDEIVYPLSALLGVLVAIYYWRKQSARTYAEEVASELAKVTWPSGKEVVNSTVVVVITTIVATLFFALMDGIWKNVTDWLYRI